MIDILLLSAFAASSLGRLCISKSVFCRLILHLQAQYYSYFHTIHSPLIALPAIFSIRMDFPSPDLSCTIDKNFIHKTLWYEVSYSQKSISTGVRASSSPSLFRTSKGSGTHNKILTCLLHFYELEIFFFCPEIHLISFALTNRPSLLYRDFLSDCKAYRMI